MIDYRSLPVYTHKDVILSALEKHPAIVVESPTGSGKTTQIPVILSEAGYAEKGIIGVTQPRRIAAISVSEFISRQIGKPVGSYIGYKMRFEDRTGPDTRLKILTDGMLLQEMKLDPLLSRYSVIMVDEAHERSLTIDFVLGLLKRVIEARPEFKVIVSSATINAQVFSEYFGDSGDSGPCPIVKIDAQAFPVTLIYDPPPAESNADALQFKIESIVERIIGEGREGDILIFLPGEKAIKDCAGRLSLCAARESLHLIPLYARLGKDEQGKVFEAAPPGKVKVIIATNIAETSVTIDGVTSVIDSGLAKLSYYNPKTFTTSLVETPISKASCNQRKGRAGRTRPGACYRLFSRKDFENRPLFTTEEIFRTDLSEVVLRMAELGIDNFEDFDFISQPGREPIRSAIESLSLLDALEPDRSLSKTGEMMCAFPLLPRHSRMIVEAIQRYPKSIEDVVIASSFLTTQSPFVLPPGEEMEARLAHHSFRDNSGDFASYLRIFRAYKAAPVKAKFCEKYYLDEKAMAEICRVKEQIEIIVSELGVPILSGGDMEEYLCSVSRGLIQFVAVNSGREGYRTLTADRIAIHPGSVMYREHAAFIVAGEIVKTTRTYAMSVSPLQRSWLPRISPLLGERLANISSAEETPRGAKQGRSAKDERDFTNQVKISDIVFPIEKEKGRKKLVVFDWKKLKSIEDPVRAAGKSGIYGDLRGVVRYDGFAFLEGEKVGLILRVAPLLDPEADLAMKPPTRRSYSSSDEPEELIEALDHILTLTAAKGAKKGRERGDRGELGFAGLFSDGQGSYWFKPSRGFHTALNESLASLENLVDELGEGANHEWKEKVSSLYRKLSELLG
jgi:ATP-dependent helicase HrpA